MRLSWRAGAAPSARRCSSTPPRARATPPALDEFVTLSWNAHLAEGQLADLIDESPRRQAHQRPAGAALRAARPGTVSPRRRRAGVRRARSIGVCDRAARSRCRRRRGLRAIARPVVALRAVDAQRRRAARGSRQRDHFDRAAARSDGDRAAARAPAPRGAQRRRHGQHAGRRRAASSWSTRISSR